MTTGAPIIEVIAFIGNVKSNPGICETISQNNMMMDPIKMVLQNNIQ